MPIDARSEVPDLSTRAAEHADQALRIFDHLAGNTEGEEQFEAAWRCGRSLALLGRYDDALDAFAFAHHTLRAMHPSDTPPHLKPLADGLSEDRKRVAYLRDVTRYGLEYLLYRRAQEHRLAGRYEQAAAGYRQVIDTAQDTMTRLLIEKLSTEFTTPEASKKLPGAGVDESPYTAASRLYEALCLIELGQAREAVQRLEAFADEDPATTPEVTPRPDGEAERIAAEQTTLPGDRPIPAPPLLFRGQALLELGRLALEHELDLDRADEYFARLDHWIVKARADNADWE
ncbi:MAG: tetratricopeptide repeat protein [Planctomycetes bacterium]|nr:tetratricopeptide repeat protein [Planctomycetota bacterium]